METTLKQIIQVIAELDSVDVIDEHSVLTDDLGLDSLMRMDMALDISSRLRVSLGEEQLATIKTFGDLVRAVSVKLAG